MLEKYKDVLKVIIDNHNNNEAFPNAIDLYNKELMTVRGKGKYTYNQFARQEGEIFLEI